VTTVRIPPVLRAQAGGSKTLELGGGTVGDVLAALIAAHPGLRGQILADDGGLNRFVNVYVDGQDVRFTGELTTPVGERDEVVILPAMAGGAAFRRAGP
jgi:molybdopterin converting factor small subunit